VVETVVDMDDFVLLGTLSDLTHQCFHDALAGGIESVHLVRMDNLRYEITAEDTPGGAIGCGADVFALVAENYADRKHRRTACKDGALPNKCLLGEGVGGDENERFGAKGECENRAVLVGELVNNFSEVNGISGNPEEVSDEWKRAGTRWKLAF